MNKVPFLLILFFSFITSLFSIDFTIEEQNYLNSKKHFTVMNVDKFQPFTFLENNQPAGYTVDIIKLMGKTMNKEIQFRTQPWEEQLVDLENGSLDIIPYIVNTKERQKKILFTEFSHITFFIGFVLNKESDIDSISDLNGKTVAIVKNSFMYNHIKKNFPKIKLLPTKSVQKSLELIIQNKAFATLDNINTLNYHIKNKWLTQLKIDTISDLGLPISNKLYMGVKKDNKILKQILEKVHKELPFKEVQKLKIKWLDDNTNLKLTEKEQKYLDSKNYLSVASFDNFQPFNFRTNGQFLGYSIEKMNLIGKLLDKEIKFNTDSWEQQLEMLKNGTLDVVPHVAITEERKKFIEYTNFSHITFHIGFLINKNNDISSMSDFKGKTIAVVNKYYLHDHLKKIFPEIKLLTVPTTLEGVQAVAQGKAFAVIDNIPTLNYFMEEKWLTNLKVDTVKDFGLPLETKLPMGVTKGNLLLKSILEKANTTIPRQDLLKLKKNWISIDKQSEVLNNLSDQETEYLNKKEKLFMCVLPNTLPFEQIDENGNHKGISSEIITIISKYIDTPIELVPTETWTESLYNIKERKCDILPIAMDLPERRKSMNFTKPYIVEPFVIVTKDTELFVKDSRMLSNKKIGSVRNYAFSSVLKEQNPLIELVEVKNTKDGLDKVRNGELFGYIDTMPVVGYMMQKHSMIDLKIAGKLEFDISLSIASRNDEPILNEIMQKALNTISEDRKRTIIGKWISIKIAQEFDYSMFWKIIGVFLIILLVILYKNRTVRIINDKLVEANRETKEQQKMVDKYVLILTTDLKGTITGVNEAYCKAIGFTKSELIGNTHKKMKHPKMDESVFNDMWNVISEDKVWNGELRNLTKDGETIWFSLIIEPVFKNSRKVGYRSISENITDKKEIEKLSITDQLTKLYNRHKLEDSFIKEISRANRYEHPLSMIILDIDHFKAVNDLYGHDIGDETLKSVAEILRTSTRMTDIVGRWGGEEFIIIVPDTDLEHTKQLAEKIRNSVESYNFKEVGAMTASFGLSTLSMNDNKESFVKKADEALYKAKENGRNRIEVNG